MATFKAVVFQTGRHIKLDGTSNIKIRIYHNRESQYISTAYYIRPENMDESGRILSGVTNGEMIGMLKMESGSHYVELSVDDNMTGYARTTSTHCQENNIRINGVFKGAFVESGKFEFLDEDGNIKHGKISEDIDEDMIVEYIRRYSNENCTMMILERNFTFKDGRKSTSYELIDIQKEIGK